MIGTPGEGRGWAAASALSLALHAGVAGYALFQPSFAFLRDRPDDSLPQIEITTMMPETPPAPVEIPTETLTSSASPDAAPEAEPALEAGQPDMAETAETLTPPPSEVLQSELSGVIQPTMPSGQNGTAPETTRPAPEEEPDLLPIQGESEAEPPDPRLVELYDRIRDRLTEPCLLALPMMRGEDQLQLSVMADTDRNITALMDDLTEGIEGEITREAVVLDRRQCGAIAFARRDQRYPVFGLGVQLRSQDIPMGETVSGQITNASGYYTTLLLVDETGYVHDLRSAMTVSSRRIEFSFPIARPFEARDTHQLLIAIATPERPDTVTQYRGEPAEQFFEDLFAEIGQEALIGVSSLYAE